MEFNQYIWDLYKNSDKGRFAIELFEKYKEPEILDKYFSQIIIDDETKAYFSDFTESAYVCLADMGDIPQSIDEAENIFKSMLKYGLSVGRDVYVDTEEYNYMLSVMPMISTALYLYDREHFFPYFFLLDFYTITKTFDYYEIELPAIPKKSNYKERCEYYFSLCEILYAFRMKNNLSPSELCAFLYDYSPNIIRKITDKNTPSTQAWFIGGKISEREFGSFMFWQGNADTRKGDILIMYETSPISSITSIWESLINGIIDPFFYYYSNVYIGNRIEIPHISLDELRSDDYFSKHPLVKKNFQGVNGWAISGDDYSNLKRLILSKSDIILPELYKPSPPERIEVKNERDVEVQLLEPLLKELGFSESDYVRQLPIRAGRGYRIFPDYALKYCNDKDNEKAKILIEAKFIIKSNKDLNEAFSQALSYAKILQSSVIAICDKSRIIIYEKTDSFDRDVYDSFYWDMNSDDYNRLKKILC